MSITINGTVLEDGAPLLVGGVQAQSVTCNGVEVWRNNSEPGTITDFEASSSGADDKVTVTFTNATGVPTPTYNLYENSVVVASGISSGHVHTSTVSGSNVYYVKALNSAGSSDSNTDTALVWAGGSSYVITSSETITAGIEIPADTAITMEILGGGGGGGGGGGNYGGNGGKTSVLASRSGTYTSGTTLPAVIGEGGLGGVPWTITTPGHGEDGTDSSIGGYIAAGGAGGTNINSWLGSDGEDSVWGTGGVRGNVFAPAGDGEIGAGGGGVFQDSLWPSGKGGRGEIRLSW